MGEWEKAGGSGGEWGKPAKLGGTEKISRWCMKRCRSPMMQGLDWGERKKFREP